MRSINGVTLQGSEYRKLKLLVECSRSGGDAKLCADEPNASEHRDSGQNTEILLGLLDVGLIKGVRAYGGVVFKGVTQAGFDFVDDLAEFERSESERVRSSRRHDWKIAAFGAVAGGVLGLFGGALSGWLISVF